MKTIITDDGSVSLYNDAIKETYHSTHGAITESVHVFIHGGLSRLPIFNPIKIIEVGLGTGLNALLTYQFAVSNNVQISYTSLEPFPLAEYIVEQLNYELMLHQDFLKGFLRQIHQSEWEINLNFHGRFDFRKYKEKVQDFTSGEKFHLVYFDAFAASKQPEIWEISIFQKLYNLLEFGGSLVSYAASGQFKRNLRQSGFEVQTLPGPPGKKEMTRAVKI